MLLPPLFRPNTMTQSPVEKRYISANELLQDAFRLGLEVFKSGYRPDFIVGVWRGGTPIAIAVQEILQLCGVSCDHLAIRTNSYSGIGERDKSVRVDGLEYLFDKLQPHHKLLLVDDIFDTGLSLQAVIEQLHAPFHTSAAPDIRIATPWFARANNRTQRQPDYYLYESDCWLVFPHELEGLTSVELQQHKPDVAQLLDEYADHIKK